MTYRAPRETVHPLLWSALLALVLFIGLIAYLIWSVWPT